MTTRSTIEKARGIEKRYGKSYYLATLFLPPHIRNAVFVLYAFVRIPDELVDNPRSGSNATEELIVWEHDWKETYTTGTGTNDILVAAAAVFRHFDIPFALSEEFLAAMRLDLTKTRYQDFDELTTYTRGSAEVIGMMLTYIFGYTDKRAFHYATLLGRAMQYTNFLRDIREDYERGRIYLPESLRTAHGVTEDMIKHHAPTPEFVAMMKTSITEVRALYREAELGIPLLSPETQRAVTLAARFYASILDAIESQHYDIFTTRAHVSTLRKLAIIARTYAGK